MPLTTFVFETSTPPGDPPERGEEVEEGAGGGRVQLQEEAGARAAGVHEEAEGGGVRVPHKPDQPVERPQGEAHPGLSDGLQHFSRLDINWAEEVA